MATSGSSSSSPMTSSVSVNEVVSGSHLFKITGHSLTGGIGVGEPITSAVFTVGGCDWAIDYYPDGYQADDADYISFFLALKSNHPDVKIYWAIKLLDPAASAEMPPSAVPVDSKLHTFGASSRKWGYRRFFKRAELEESRFLKNDCFAVMCTVQVKTSRVDRVPYVHPSAPPPPIELHDHLGRLLERGEGADVTFEVGGETFAAHRCVLAARSPVFSAQFFGPMSEKSTQCVRIEDIEAAAFRALLHFMYRDSLSLPEDGEEPRKASTAMAQHLLPAADRYGLERLKLICEDRLCNSVDADTAATTLALAEQHGCLRLKKVCLEFAVVPENLISMVLSEGFEHLRMSCPSVLEELRMKMSRHSGSHANGAAARGEGVAP